MEFRALEVALEAPEIFLAVPEMAPTTEQARILEKILERKLARIPEMEPAKALEISQSGQWVLSFQPLASFAVADS